MAAVLLSAAHFHTRGRVRVLLSGAQFAWPRVGIPRTVCRFCGCYPRHSSTGRILGRGTVPIVIRRTFRFFGGGRRVVIGRTFLAARPAGQKIRGCYSRHSLRFWHRIFPIVIRRTFPICVLLSAAQFTVCRILRRVVIDSTIFKKPPCSVGIVLLFTAHFQKILPSGLLITAQFAKILGSAPGCWNFRHSLQKILAGLLSAAQFGFLLFSDFRVVIGRTFCKIEIFCNFGARVVTHGTFIKSCFGCC